MSCHKSNTGEKMPKIKKIDKSSKKKSTNIVPIRKDVEIENPEQVLSIEEQERARTNKFARKLCDEIDEFIKECKLSSDHAYYYFLYHIKQRTIMNVSYSLFKSANEASTNEATENLSEYLKENAPELKTDATNNTIQ